MISNILEKKFLRLDLYLYYIRIFKSRSIATKFILTNRLRISGQVTQKPHKMISVGDVLTMTINDNMKVLKVLDIPNRRGPYSESLNFTSLPIDQLRYWWNNNHTNNKKEKLIMVTSW